MVSRSNLGPLTTTFTAPASCSVHGAGDVYSGGVLWLAQGCTTGVLHDNVDCWPTATVAPTSTNLEGFGFYSPGLICPEGYYSACGAAQPTDTSTLNIANTFKPQFALMAGETAIGCCPVGLHCHQADAGGAQTCITAVTAGTLTVGTCTLPNSFVSYSQPIGTGFPVTDDSGSISTVSVAEAVLYGPLIQLVYREEDLSTSTTTSSPTSQTPNTPSIPTQTPNSQYTSDSGGLSSGAKIGIGIGVPLGVLLLAALIAIIFLSRRRSRYNHHRDVFGGPINVGPVEKDATHTQYQPREMSGAQKFHQLPNSQRGFELDATGSQHLLAEMPGR